MNQRLDFYKASPEAIKAMVGLEQRIAKSGLEKSLIELVRLRASQINGCAYCVDMHSADARKAGENERRLAPFDARLLRPRMMPALVRFASRFMPREKQAA